MSVSGRLLTILAALAVLGAGPAPEVVELPHEFDLADARDLQLVLDHADITVRVDPDAAPVLRARLPEAARAGGATVGIQTVEIQQTARGFALRRPAAEPASPGSDQAPRPPILLDLILGPDQALELVGDTIGIRIDATPSEAAFERAPTGVPEKGTLPSAPWRLRLKDSQARLVGVEHARIDAEGGFVQLVDTVGAVRLVVDGGGLEVDGHTGYLRLDAIDSDSEIRNLAGALDFTLTGGQLEAFEVAETILGNADGGSVTIEGWRGKATLRVQATRMVVSRGAEGAELDIGGRLADLIVDDHGGPLTGDIDGGALRARTVFGPVKVDARAQATIEIAHTEERVNLALENANATVVGVPGTAYFEVDNGRIEAEDIGRFSARGENAEAVIRAVRRLEIVSFKNSTLDFDLTGIQHNPALALKGATEAHIRMPMPCSVRVAASPFAIENKVRVDGCAFYYRGNMPPRDQMTKREDERALVVNVVDEGSLDVEGVVLE